jgi:leucyl/phenylalanyl-tRNA--protein transferase
MVLQTAEFKLHRSLRKTLDKFIANPNCEIKIDGNFGAVIRHCAQTSRKGQPGTWIVYDMIVAYDALHAAGFAHSVETWIDGQLVGGLYCVSIGDTLFGESMFALRTDASKIALAALVCFARAHGIAWIDCQQNTKHLATLGAQEMPRDEFLQLIKLSPREVVYDWTFKLSYWDKVLPLKMQP